MVCAASGPSLRLPSCEERERLLGFDVGYTSIATKGSNPQDASDARAFLLGSGFQREFPGPQVHARCETKQA